MVERPIIFSGPMVLAILEGRKTQTRRILNPPRWSDGCIEIENDGPYAIAKSTGCFSKVSLPYAVGDRLWVLEAFASHASGFDYRADGDTTALWLSPIHMPRQASRITLVVTDIRVQRLQDITEDDAKAEGCDPVTHDDGAVDCGTRKTTFANLWESIHGAGSWKGNPWVVAITFERAA